MSNIFSRQCDSLTIGGRVFTDLDNLLMLYACTNTNDAAKNYATFRLGNDVAGYQVPALKVLRIDAIEVHMSEPTGGGAFYSFGSPPSIGCSLGYGDNDKGFLSAVAPAALINHCGTGPIVSGFVLKAVFGGAFLSAQRPVKFLVPAGKFPCFTASEGFACMAVAYGYLTS